MAEDDSLKDYQDEDPSVLSEEDLAGIASEFDLPVEKVKLMARGMSRVRAKVSKEQESESVDPGSIMASAIRHAEAAQYQIETLGLGLDEDESIVLMLEVQKQKIKDILASDFDLIERVVLALDNEIGAIYDGDLKSNIADCVRYIHIIEELD